eukprot:scaffold194900_cov22-Tisochrysis_lutea.AAC.1
MGGHSKQHPILLRRDPLISISHSKHPLSPEAFTLDPSIWIPTQARQLSKIRKQHPFLRLKHSIQEDAHNLAKHYLQEASTPHNIKGLGTRCMIWN